MGAQRRRGQWQHVHHQLAPTATDPLCTQVATIELSEPGAYGAGILAVGYRHDHFFLGAAATGGIASSPTAERDLAAGDVDGVTFSSTIFR